MKNTITTTALLALLTIGVNQLFAGAGHDHGHDHGHSHSHTKINEAKAKKLAIKQLNSYVAAKKLDKSWKDKPVVDVKSQIYKDTPEWIFKFHNPKEPKAEQKNLYIFINQYGELAGANFTGK